MDPPRMNRYWRRPKLRVYDCNVRDAERFYQDSYKQYLSEKEDAARRSTRARSSDTNRTTTEFYPHLLAGSGFKQAAREDVMRQANLPPLPPALAEATKSRWDSDHKVPETNFTARAEGLADFDPRDKASIEERYQKLRRLREELNLPAEGAESSALGSLRSGSVGAGGGGGGRYGTERDSYMSEQSSRSLASTGGPDETSSYSSRSERMARMNGNAGGGEGHRYKTDTSTSEYKRGGDQRSDRGGDQGSSEYRYRSERGAAGDQNSYDYKSRSERGGDQNSLDYTPRSERGGTGEQSTRYEYRLKSDRGGGDQNSYEYKPRSERGAASDLTSSDYKYKSERGGGSSDYKSRFELKSDDYKPSSRTVDFDLPKSDRKKDDYSISSSTDRKADRYSSLSSTSAVSASTERKSLASSSKDDDKEVDDVNVSDMMKKLPSSQEILERISKLELDD
ncbi:hypothetical protein GWK47_023556 [Chionoecetes opilio]|uniref:Uncharacterized protein n=1 Tax=Chionoecetes opilio TaxID=41210 RepID=A0A8J5CEG3_CHIOP|nr:hypothetical protein GWK47_023556 [Chionoecetes opilio]